MTDDITDTLAPNSTQLDAIDLLNRPPVVVTITRVDVKSDPRADQPVAIHCAEFDRPWKPGKNMRRVLGYCWGTKSSKWVGRQAELYCDESVKFGNENPGGIRISRLSHIDGPKSVPVLLSKGRSGRWDVDPLPEPTIEERIAALGVEWKQATPERRAAIEAEVDALKAGGAQ